MEPEAELSGKTVEQLIGELGMYHRRLTVCSLLEGNDTCCFTTEQYKQAYEKVGKSPPWIWKMRGGNLARHHLRSIPELVRELGNDLWAGV